MSPIGLTVAKFSPAVGLWLQYPKRPHDGETTQAKPHGSLNIPEAHPLLCAAHLHPSPNCLLVELVFAELLPHARSWHCHCEQDTFLPRCGVGVQKDAEPERIVPECGKGLRTVDLAGGWWRSGVVGRTRLSLRSGPQSGDRQHVAPSTHPLTTPCDRLRAYIRSLHCSCHLSALKQTAFVFPRCRWTFLLTYESS